MTKLRELIDYGFSRAVGHTTAMLHGFNNTPDAILIVADERQAQYLKLQRHSYLTIDSLPLSIRGMHRPLIIDHYALSILFYEHVRETIIAHDKKVHDLEKHIARLEQLIKQKEKHEKTAKPKVKRKAKPVSRSRRVDGKPHR